MREAKPDPKPRRTRGKLPTIEELGGKCQVCAWRGPGLERAHLLGGPDKEDHPDLVAVLCGDFGNPDCRVHSRYHRGPGKHAAAVEIGAVLTDRQKLAIIARKGEGWLHRLYRCPTA